MKQVFGTSIWRYALPATLLLLALGYFAIATGYPRDARLMPLLVGAVLLVMVPIDLVSLSQTRVGAWLRLHVNPAAGQPLQIAGGNRSQFAALGWMFGFCAGIYLLGIIVAVPLYIAGTMRFMGSKTWTASLIGAVVIGIANYALFQLMLGVNLYPGVFLAVS